MRAERARAAVGDEVDAQDALRVLDGLVDLAGGHVEALRDELEVVDEGLHGLPHNLADVLERVALAVRGDSQARRPGDFGIGDHGGRALALVELVEHLPDDAHRLIALVEANHRAVVDVGLVAGGDIELEVLVAAVGLALAQVQGQAGGAQRRGRSSRGP